MYLHASVPFRDIFALWGYICRNAYIYRYTYFMVYISDELLWTLMDSHVLAYKKPGYYTGKTLIYYHILISKGRCRLFTYICLPDHYPYLFALMINCFHCFNASIL